MHSISDTNLVMSVGHGLSMKGMARQTTEIDLWGLHIKRKKICALQWVLTFELVIHETAFKKMFENYLCLAAVSFLSK